jgi:hypothetical protein
LLIIYADALSLNHTLYSYKYVEGMWKDMLVPQFKVLSMHFPGGAEENHEELHS